MEPFRLETERLILRDWLPEDRVPFMAHLNTRSVMQWLGGVQSDVEFDAAMARLEGYRRDFGHTFWVVERKSDGGHLAGQLLGFCGLKRGNVVGSPTENMHEIGWRLREDAWGKGYAREAAEASRDLAFERFDAPFLVALTVIQNEPSWRLMERIGMTRAKELDFIDPRWEPEIAHTIVWKITREQWNTL